MKHLKQQTTRLLLLLVAWLSCGIAVQAANFTPGSKIYLDPGCWDVNDVTETFKIEFYLNGTGNNSWQTFTKPSGAQYWEVTVPNDGKKRDSFNLKRYNENGTSEWNKIEGQSYTDASKNLIKITDWSAYSWDTYSASTSSTLCIGGDFNSWNKTGKVIALNTPTEIDFTDKSSKYFAFFTNSGDTQIGPGTNGDTPSFTGSNTASGNQAYNLGNNGDKYTVTVTSFDATAKKVMFTITKAGGNTEKDPDWYLIGHVGSTANDYVTGTNGKQFTKQADGSYKLSNVTIPTKENNKAYIRLYDAANNKDYGASKSNEENALGTEYTITAGSNNWKAPAESKAYDFTIKDGKFTQTLHSGGDNTLPTTGWYLFGSASNWNSTWQTLTSTDDNKGTVTVSDLTPGTKYYFRVLVDGTQYGPSDDKEITFTKDDEYVLSGELNTSSSKAIYFTAEQDKEYVIEFYKEYSGKPHVRIARKAHKVEAGPAVKAYLLHSMLNNETESPAWEMQKQADGSFTLEYTMRNHDLTVRTYDENNVATNYNFTDLANTPTVGTKNGGSDGKQWTPGWRYKATFKDGNLTIAPVSGGSFEEIKDILPYVGVLGANFQQAETFTTPHDGNKADNGGKWGGNTDLGWQEAYIEYNAQGVPVLSKDGKAIYNTQWPPRNNIMLVSKLSDTEKLNTSTSDLTLQWEKEADKNGSEWESALKAENAKEYANLSLTAGTKYRRYLAKDLWMLGTFKLWTGWSGQNFGTYANWNNNIYWGPDGGNATVAPNTTIKPHGKEGNRDYEIKEKSYFETMELFIPYTDDDKKLDFENTVLYLTKAALGAQIDSYLETAEGASYHHAGFAPSVHEVPTGTTITGYTIYRLGYDPNLERESYPFVDRNRQEVAQAKAVVASKSGLEIGSKADFEKEFTFNLGGNKYVDDQEYGAGNYIYRMVIDVTEDGEAASYTVYSPYIQIIPTDFAFTPQARQLVELTKECGIEGYDYVTYSAAGNGILVGLDADGNVEKAIRMSDAGIENYADVAHEIYETKGLWTNRALVSADLPYSYTLAGENASEAEFKAGDDVTLARIAGSDSYAAVVNNGADISKHEINLTFSCKVLEGETQNAKSKTAAAAYAPAFMLPSFGEVSVEVAEVEDAEQVIVSHQHVLGGQSHTVTGASLMEITANVPVIFNVADEILSAVSVKLHGLKLNGQQISMAGTRPAAGFGINYRNQSPYDWMEYSDGNWIGKTKTFTFTHDEEEDSDITWLTPSASSVSKVLEGANFHAPTSTPALALSLEWGDETKATKSETIVAKVTASGTMTQSECDDFCSHNKLAAPTHAISFGGSNDSGAEMQTGSQVDGHEVARVVFANPCREYDPDTEAGQAHIGQELYNLLHSDAYTNSISNIAVNFGFAHFFKAKGDEVTGSNTASHYRGMTGSFCHIRTDLGGSATAAPAKLPGVVTGPATTLTDNDNAFLFAPEYAEVKLDDTIPTGIGEIAAEVEGADCVYYTLEGIRVERPGKGLYIRVANGKTEKVVL